MKSKLGSNILRSNYQVVLTVIFIWSFAGFMLMACSTDRGFKPIPFEKIEQPFDKACGEEDGAEPCSPEPTGQPRQAEDDFSPPTGGGSSLGDIRNDEQDNSYGSDLSDEESTFDSQIPMQIELEGAVVPRNWHDAVGIFSQILQAEAQSTGDQELLNLNLVDELNYSSDLAIESVRGLTLKHGNMNMNDSNSMSSLIFIQALLREQEGSLLDIVSEGTLLIREEGLSSLRLSAGTITASSAQAQSVDWIRIYILCGGEEEDTPCSTLYLLLDFIDRSNLEEISRTFAMFQFAAAPLGIEDIVNVQLEATSLGVDVDSFPSYEAAVRNTSQPQDSATPTESAGDTTSVDSSDSEPVVAEPLEVIVDENDESTETSSETRENPHGYWDTFREALRNRSSNNTATEVSSSAVIDGVPSTQIAPDSSSAGEETSVDESIVAAEPEDDSEESWRQVLRGFFESLP